MNIYFPLSFVCMFVLIVAKILNPRVEDNLIYFPVSFLVVFAGGDIHNSPFTHTAYHELGPIPGSRKLRIRMGCVAMLMRM